MSQQGSMFHWQNAYAVTAADLMRTRAVLWAAWRELNTIRARDGVPYTHLLIKAGVDETYFSDVVDACADVLGDDAKPWPSKQWLAQDGSFDITDLQFTAFDPATTEPPKS